MASIPFLYLIFLLIISSPVLSKGSNIPSTVETTQKHELKTYVVHVKQPEGRVLAQYDDISDYHQSFLPVVDEESNEQTRLVYSYKNVIGGFSARLTEDELNDIKMKDGFVSARPEKMYRLLTTHTPEFLGLHPQTGFWKESQFGKGAIIGVLDTGIFPNHPSFSDEGMPPTPAKWKGKCEFNASDCNNKIIGARSFNVAAMASKGVNSSEPPLDDDGHGTHTASTAAGVFVKNVDVLGNAKGTAVGIAPYAHLAIYKVCFGPDCPESDILAGLDAAVADGVDVISISLGNDSRPFFMDNIAVASFAAVQKGIFVSCAAGNSGPNNSTISNEAPWILTVGASTIDRTIKATAKLGNGEEFDGQSLFQPDDFPQTPLPLLYAGSNGNLNSSLCMEGSLKELNVKGKVVLCERGEIQRIDKGKEVKNAGGAAMILMNIKSAGFDTDVDAHVLPATHVSYVAGLKIKDYVNSTKSPVASILFKGTVIGDPLAPAIASFSSRGPNLASPGILKPDIIGPGVSILAAWPFPLNGNTNSKFTYEIISGTSMSCPHLSGLAALLKISHPHWSPAAIKSAIMTSADLVNFKGTPIVDQLNLQPADIFSTGAGHVNPLRANDPGLVYDIQPDDYIPYLCGLGYTDEQVGIIAHRPINCSEESSIPEGQLNYPSISVALGPSQTFTRTVTNVGEACSSYVARIVAPKGVNVSVKPDKLYFSKVNQKMSYSVTFRSHSGNTIEFSQGYLEWISTKHIVRSVISVIGKKYSP